MIVQYIKILFFAIVVLLTLSGCVSKDTKELLSSYAKNSKIAQENIISSYKNTIDNMQTAKYYQAVRDGATVSDLEIKKIDYSGQMKTLKNLLTFSEAMVVLSGDSHNDKIDESTLKLHESVKKLSENKAISIEVSQKDMQIFSIALNGLLKSYGEHIRLKKLKEIILISDKWVQPSIDMLSKDLDNWKNLLRRSLNKQNNIKTHILNKPYTYCQVKDKNRKCIPLVDSLENRLNMYAELSIIQKRINNLNKEFIALSNSVTLMSKMHKKVIESLKRDDINKDELKRVFYDLKTHVESIKDYRKSLKGDE